MKREILKLKKLIDAKRAEFDAVRREQNRAQHTAKSAVDDTGAIAELQRKRSEVLGKAYLAGETADTDQIDREIERIEAGLREARKTAEGAAAAVALLDDKATNLLEEEGVLRQRQAALIRDLFKERFDEAKNRYVEKVYEVIDALKALQAIERGLEYFRGQNEPKPTLVLTEQLLIALRSRGLYLPPAIEKIRYPDLAWDVHLPYVLDADHHGEFGVKEIDEINRELQEYGFQ